MYQDNTDPWIDPHWKKSEERPKLLHCLVPRVPEVLDSSPLLVLSSPHYQGIKLEVFSFVIIFWLHLKIRVFIPRWIVYGFFTESFSHLPSQSSLQLHILCSSHSMARMIIIFRPKVPVTVTSEFSFVPCIITFHPLLPSNSISPF